MLVTYVDSLGNVVKESVVTYKDIFISSDGKIITSNKCLLLLFGMGESRWLVQNEEFSIYVTGDTLIEAFQEFDDFLIYNYNKFIKSDKIQSFQEFDKLKKLYLETFKS